MAVSNISGRIDRLIGDMGLYEEICRTNAANYKGKDKSKQGDAAWVPYVRLEKGDWPTLVMECAVTQTKHNLDAACRWWLSESHGKVKIVIAIDVDRKERKLHIEVWKRGLVGSRYFLRGRQEEEEGPVVDYQFDISGEDSGGAELTLDFKSVMLRDPVNDDDEEEEASPDEAGGGRARGRRRQAPMTLGGGEDGGEAGDYTAGEEGEEQEEEEGDGSEGEEQEEEEGEGEEESEEAVQLGIARPQLPPPTPSTEGGPPEQSTRKDKARVPEGDFVITAAELGLYARGVWKVPPSGKLSPNVILVIDKN